MYPFLPGCAETVSLHHDGRLIHHDSYITVCKEEQGDQDPRHAYLTQRRTESVHGRCGNEQKRSHQRKASLHHQRQHGYDAACDNNVPYLQEDPMIQERIYKPHRTYERQNDPEFVKEHPHRHLCRLEKEHRI